MTLLRYLTTAVVCFINGLFKDAVSNPHNIVSLGTRVWKAVGGRCRLVCGFSPEKPDMTEENHEEP
jgi:hypothetical protein